MTERQLDSRVQEFPLIDERYTGLPYRYAFTVELDAGQGTALCGPALLRHDLATGRSERHVFAGGRLTRQTRFPAARRASREADGWLLTLVYDPATDRSELVVLDPRRIHRAARRCGPAAGAGAARLPRAVGAGGAVSGAGEAHEDPARDGHRAITGPTGDELRRIRPKHHGVALGRVRLRGPGVSPADGPTPRRPPPAAARLPRSVRAAGTQPERRPGPRSASVTATFTSSARWSAGQFHCLRRGDRAQDRDADGEGDLLGHRGQARREALLLVGQARGSGHRVGHDAR